MTSASDAVASRWPSPRALHGLGRHRPGPRGLPGSAVLAETSLGGIDPRVLDLPFEAPLQRSEPQNRRDPEIPTGQEAPPLVRFVHFVPLHRSTARASTPPVLRGRFGPALPDADITFRPRGLSPPRRVPPRGGCGLVASRSRSWGSPRFAPPHAGPKTCMTHAGSRPA